MGTPLVKQFDRVTWHNQALDSAPFLVRHARLGYLTFCICSLLFALLTWQVVTHGPLTQLDLPVITAIHAWAKIQPPLVVLAMRFAGALGRDGLGLIILILAIIWMIRKAEREISFLIMGVLGSELLFQLISNLVGRERPPFKDPFETLIGPGYPSGHAATNLAMAFMVLYLLLPRIKKPWAKALMVIAFVLLVAWICFSRLFLGLHYPTDIAAGLLLGLGWAALVITSYDLYWWRRRKTAPNSGG